MRSPGHTEKSWLNETPVEEIGEVKVPRYQKIFVSRNPYFT